MIEIKDLCVDVGGFTLDNISLSINDGEYFIVLGPTGAGKTVLLESIAGLYKVRRGEIRLGNKDVSQVEPEKRRISIVYQDFALFPHISIKDNITFGLRMRKEKSRRITAELQWVAQLFGIEHLLQRRPVTLSGGERQKVALARAIVTRPEVLLLDEPLGALDPESREKMQEELFRLHGELAMTILHVTHDFEEAIALGGRMAVIGEGTIKQVGTSEEIFRRPNSEFVARFVMAKNILSGTAEKKVDGTTVFKVGTMEFITTSALVGECRACIRPEDIFITREPVHEKAHNYFLATITKIVNKGSVLNVIASLPPDLICLVTCRDFAEMGLEKGQGVFLSFPASSVHLFRG